MATRLDDKMNNFVVVDVNNLILWLHMKYI